MNKPIWIINSALLALLLLLAGFMAWYKPPLSPVVPLTPKQPPREESAYSERVDALDILKNDPFGTYVAEDHIEEKMSVTPVPQVPQEVSIKAPEEDIARFVEPLPITLTGIIFFNDARVDRAIIMDNNTKQEVTYKAGDSLLDAQIVAIYPQRVLLVRSNGQQEYLYLTTEDTQRVHQRIEQPDWAKIIKNDKGSMLVDKEEFIREVVNLSRFIDMFDISTAFKDGVSIGSKIGSIKETSLPYAMGLRSNDIILDINRLPARTTTERLDIFDAIKKLPTNGLVACTVVRNNKKITVSFKLGEIETIAPEQTLFVSEQKNVADEKQAEIKRQYAEVGEEEKQRILKEKYKFAATAHDLEKMERRHIATIKGH